MKVVSTFASTAVLAAAVSAQGCQEIAGNFYCNQVEQIVYQNVGYSGSYNKVSAFNTDGSCSSQPFGFSGSIAPLDEDLSVHFRGPVDLKQFAVYYPSSGSQKRDAEPAVHRRHEHHVHKRDPLVTEFEFVHVTKTVFAGDQPSPEPVESSVPATTLVSSAAAPPAPAPAPSSSSPPPPPPPAPSSSSEAAAPPPPSSTEPLPAPVSSSSSVSTSTSSSAAPASSSAPASSGSGWSQAAYYNSQAGSANGLVFMNNLGGGGSGVFDMQFGNSISYAGSDGVSCASSPQVLSDQTLPSNKEVIIFSDTQCSGDSCGFFRPGIPAFEGFGGATKIFAFEFGMPSAGGGGGFNFDMPAIWLLNAQIPRTLEYGNAECSCWTTGCGEFDIFEVLNAGNDKLTNHLHSGQGGGGAQGGGGSADYFPRPTSGTMKAAVIFDGAAQTISIVQLDDSTVFPSSLDESTVSGWLSSTASSNNFVNIA